MHLDMMSFDYEPNNYDPQSQSNYTGEITENFFTNLTSTTNINLTDTQNELVEKFNAAFVEAQNSPKYYHQSQTENYHPHLHPAQQQQQFPDNFDTNSETNFLLDIFMSKSPSQTTTTNSNPSTDLENYGLFYDENSKPEQADASVFFINPPSMLPAANNNNNAQRHFENLDDLCLSEIDFCDNISNSSFDIETITTELCENEAIDFDYENTCMEPRFVEPLPSVTTFGRNFAEKKYIELNNFIRHSAPDTINLFATETEQKNTYGHLLGNKPMNNNISVVLPESNYEPVSSNQLVLTQTEAILHDDPLLSSSSCVFPNRRIRHRSDSSFTGSTYENSDAELDEANSLLFQCKWEDCYQLYPDQRTLVRHIEKSHVEMKKGEEFACSWINCPRKNKPFNARYKLLIHMRVHSGEKPNKCPFKGCSKAFSRLENLKIHQRSHTGERPYLCQFNQCTKSFSNSSDRAKHQRTHYDTKPYACQITGCQKRYTDPSSLRKHVKNHTLSEQAQLKKKQQINRDLAPPKPSAHDMPEKREFKKISITHNTTQQFQKLDFNNDFLIAELKNQKDHSYSTCHDIFENFVSKDLALKNVKIDLKNKISEKNRQKKLYENMY